MLPDPLHPAVVHFPIVLAVLFPVFAAVLLWKTRGMEKPGRVWAWVVVYAALTGLSVRIATGTGEGQEDRVEDVVAGDVIHEHEEKAELLTVLAVVTLVLSGVGLARGKVGIAGRGLTLLVSVAMASQAVWVGKTGGELVYVHGAARAYVGTDAGGLTGAEGREGMGLPAVVGENRREEDDDD